MPKAKNSYKIVLLGLGGVGKTAIALQFVKGTFLEKYDPTIEDTYRKEIEYDKKEKSVFEILDTAGSVFINLLIYLGRINPIFLIFLKDCFRGSQDNYYKNGQGFIFVYSVTSKESVDYLLNIKDDITRVRNCTIDKVWNYYFFA
jgi:Ras-related protein Rap-1B